MTMKIEKQVWVTPEIIDLDIDKTGKDPNAYESTPINVAPHS